MATATPIKLQLNKKYPSYQLYAIAGTSQMDPDDVFRACILYTYKWLRARFDGFTIKELDVPAPPAALHFDVRSLKSFAITDPYPIEIVWLPEDKVWSLKLTEPDNGSEATDYRPARDAVAGRLFETNVGYRITDKGVECGFKTIVSEPEGIDAPVGSFRLACIKEIARDPDIGLYHWYKLVDEPVTVDTSAAVKKLIRWIRSDERQLPVIISDLGEQKTDNKKLEALAASDQFRPTTSFSRYTSVSSIAGLKLTEVADSHLKENSPGPRIDIKKLSRYKMGYAQYFVVTKEMSELVNKEFAKEYRQGGFNVFEPRAFGGRVRSYNAFNDKTEQELDSFASIYPSKKPMTFANVLFTNDARELASRRNAEHAESKESSDQAHNDHIAAINAIHDDEISSYRSKLDDEIRERHGLESALESIHSEYAKKIDNINKTHKEELERLSLEYKNDLLELERYRSLERRPGGISGIQEWVASEFEGKLMLHEKAQKLLLDLKPGEGNVGLICDALEFLAIEYRDKLIGAITEDEMNAECSRKYHRRFVVEPLSFDSVQSADKEYKIKYYPNYKGNPGDSLLDLHLKIGNKSEDLIRVYFLYDKNKQLIVVGSLPKHLP